MASHFPPPEYAGGDAIATASRMAWNSAATVGETAVEEAKAGDRPVRVIVGVALEEMDASGFGTRNGVRVTTDTL
jgi:hypothetical protein